jgi:metal-responsive CopG/Arc/MetJ family transcriptional regulator
VNLTATPVLANCCAAEYFSSMKQKTSITLSRDLLAAVDRLAGRSGSRSAVIERALRAFLRARERSARNRRDVATLNQYAAELNAEASDVLMFQTVSDVD